ncbi:MAG: YggS family pyridoxal phosphate-dependent enzyme [Acidimicrobiaceae bacterium]|nr:YggS family pyridoxal phosphate-dependent enzyme [Acidimicrobiaceae bacterium]
MIERSLPAGMAGGDTADAAFIAGRLLQVRERLSAVNGEGVRVVAVTKAHAADVVAAAIDAGCTDIGESYAQELLHKNRELLADCQNRPQVHFVGGLQRNKIRKLASIVDVWQSVDRLDLGEELARRSPRARVMVQVDLSGEQAKRGCPAEKVPDLVARFADLGLDVVGLMGIGPTGAPEKARPGFAMLRGLVDRLGLSECSMGMTADLEIAVQEGSTMVRVGTCLFGPRPSRRRKIEQ